MQITQAARRHVRLVTAGLALVLATTGCATATPGPEADDDAAARAQAKPTPGPTAPELPASARNFDASGARAAARYFLELEHYTVLTGDLSEWRRVSLPGCEYCAETVQQVETDRESRRRTEGGDVTFEWTVLPVEEGGTFYTRSLVSMTPAVRYASDGAVAEELAGGDILVDLQVREVRGAWLIADGDAFIYPWSVHRAAHPDQAV